MSCSVPSWSVMNQFTVYISIMLRLNRTDFTAVPFRQCSSHYSWLISRWERKIVYHDNDYPIKVCPWCHTVNVSTFEIHQQNGNILSIGLVSVQNWTTEQENMFFFVCKASRISNERKKNMKIMLYSLWLLVTQANNEIVSLP